MRQLKITKSITNRESESLEKYLQEIGREDLLSTDEEVELAQRIRKGDRKALDKLTKANLRFVVSVAKQYQNQGLSLPRIKDCLYPISSTRVIWDSSKLQRNSMRRVVLSLSPMPYGGFVSLSCRPLLNKVVLSVCR